jgi:hypothetical protein
MGEVPNDRAQITGDNILFGERRTPGTASGLLFQGVYN